MYGDPECLYIVATISPSSEIRQVKLNLVPPLIQPHRHRADEWFHTRSRLVVWGSEPSPYVLIVQYLHFESKIFFELNEYAGTFLMIMTRKGSLMPSVSLGFCGQVMKAVVTLVPMISKTEDWMSWSVILLMWPLWTTLDALLLSFSQIWSGLLPMLYRIDKNPDW